MPPAKKRILSFLMTRTLFGLHQSPWTERARWPLEHHGIRFEYHEHVPMLGELLLRRKAGVKNATVPLLSDGDDVVMGSSAIAEYAEKIGGGAPLFPHGRSADIARWVDVAERMSSAGRAWFLKRFVDSREAKAESLPTFVPSVLRGALLPTTTMAIRFLEKKYDVPADVEREIERTLRPLLRELREAIKEGGYVLSGASPAFTYADVALAATMQVLRPWAGAKLGPATREAWTNEALAREFDDLVAWRDAIYGKHR